MKPPYSNPRASLTTAVILHLIFFLCAGFLAMPRKQKEPEHLFELVPPPVVVTAPEPEPVAPPPPEPEPEPEPEPPTPEPTPPPEPVVPEPPPQPKPEPRPAPAPPKPKKMEPKPRPPVKKVTPPRPKPTPPLIKKRVQPKPQKPPIKRPAPRVKKPKTPKIDALPRPSRPRSNTPRGPVIAKPPVSQAAKDKYLQKFYGILKLHWQRPPDANKPVMIMFTVSSSGRLQSFSLVARSGDARLDASILQALNTMRNRGITIPPPGGRTGTYKITCKPG